MIFSKNEVLVSKIDHTILATEHNDGTEFIPLRELLFILDKTEMDRILYNYQMHTWSLRAKFCGVCGNLTEFEEVENCRVCTKCHEKYFPSLFPAVIVSIIKDDKILLAHNAGFKGNLHSIIAGFVDLGESLEECVRREVREEVGIEIEDIKYYGSQNWGFSSSLMIGFKAKYKSGAIKIDGKEITKADWFTKDNLPELPPKTSIGRNMIEDFINR